MQEYELQQTLFRQNNLNQKHFIQSFVWIFFFSQQRENSTIMKTIEIELSGKPHGNSTV